MMVEAGGANEARTDPTSHPDARPHDAKAVFPSRRGVMLGAAAASLGFATAETSWPPALAQVVDLRPPTIDTSDPKEVADGVWVLRDHRVWLVPNVGIVVGHDAALVIDTGLGPANGERVYEIARRIAGRRRLIMTTTHFHPEHTTGAQAFPTKVSYVCNSAQRDDIVRNGTRFVDLFRKTQNPAAFDALGNQDRGAAAHL